PERLRQPVAVRLPVLVEDQEGQEPLLRTRAQAREGRFTQANPEPPEELEGERRRGGRHRRGFLHSPYAVALVVTIRRVPATISATPRCYPPLGGNTRGPLVEGGSRWVECDEMTTGRRSRGGSRALLAI